MTDEQLGRSVPIVLFEGRRATPREVIEGILIGHIGSHMANVRAGIGG